MQLVCIFLHFIPASHNSVSFFGPLNIWLTVWKGNINPYIHSNVSNKFYRTIIHGESNDNFTSSLTFIFKQNYSFNGIIYKKSLILIVTPFFHFWTSQQKSPIKRYMQFQRSPQHPLPVIQVQETHQFNC